MRDRESGRGLRRRTFVKRGASAAAGLALGPWRAFGQESAGPVLMTVRGPISPMKAGRMLPHEHLMSTFGATAEQAAGYDRDEAFRAVLPYLEKVKALGCGTIADCTAAYFGRDPALLRRLSKASGIHVLTNTGYYGAADDRYVPEHAYSDSVDDLAARWVKEYENGIPKTGIRPGFLKIGVDGGPLSEIDAKLVRAGARAHLRTGLTMAVHTGGSVEAAYGELEILKEEGVDPSAWVWVHAHGVAEPEEVAKAATAGAWIEFDAIREGNIERHLELVRYMKSKKLLHRVLLSHDGNTYRVSGGEPRLYEALFTTFVPRLRNAGFGKGEIRQMTVVNPARAFAVRVRKA